MYSTCIHVYNYSIIHIYTYIYTCTCTCSPYLVSTIDTASLSTDSPNTNMLSVGST